MVVPKLIKTAKEICGAVYHNLIQPESQGDFLQPPKNQGILKDSYHSNCRSDPTHQAINDLLGDKYR